MSSTAVRRLEWLVSLLVSAAVITLLIIRAQHAGALWRDECASVQLAQMPDLNQVLENFQRESFPALFPLLVRFYTQACGGSDVSFRMLGVAVGLISLGCLWVNGWLLARRPPLLGPVLLLLNPAFLVWGTSVRAYGIGSAAMILASGLLAWTMVRPAASRFVVAGIVSIISAHLLLYNWVLLAAVGLSAVAVCLIARRTLAALWIFLICVLSALSVAVYLGPFRAESRSTVIFQAPVDLLWYLKEFALTLGVPVPLTAGIWAAVFMGIAFLAIRRLRGRNGASAEEVTLLRFGLAVMVLSILFYFAFVEIVHYRTRAWYYIALLGVLAATADWTSSLVVASSVAWRTTRLVTVIVAGGVFSMIAWPRVMERQTNMDSLAQQIGGIAPSGDLIVVNPWFYGVGFNRYYHGAASWVTCPMVNDVHLHRFDLIKERMMSSTPLDDLFQAISTTLQHGQRVWFVGELKFLPEDRAPIQLPPAPGSEYGWSGDAYGESWSLQLGDFVKRHATGFRNLPLPENGPVNEFENLPAISGVIGWRE